MVLVLGSMYIYICGFLTYPEKNYVLSCLNTLEYRVAYSHRPIIGYYTNNLVLMFLIMGSDPCLQGSGLERNFHVPLHDPSPTPTHRAETFLAQQSEGSSLNNSLAQLEQRNRVGDEDDFIVPVFVQSGAGSRTQNSVDREKLTHFSPRYSGRSIKHQNVCDKDPKLMTSLGPDLRKEVRCEFEEVPKASGPSHSAKSKTNLSTKEKIEGLVKESNAIPDQEYQNFPVTNICNLDDSDLQQEFRTRSQPIDNGLVGSIREGDVAHRRRQDFPVTNICNLDDFDLQQDL